MQTDKQVILQQDFSSDKESRHQIIKIITSHIIKFEKNLELTIDEILLATDEALTNAMEHGNRWNPAKRIHLTISVLYNVLNITIRDEGNGFNKKFIKDDIKNIEILGPRGRGIYIIHQFCNPTWNTIGNEVNLEIKLKKKDNVH